MKDKTKIRKSEITKKKTYSRNNNRKKTKAKPVDVETYPLEKMLSWDHLKTSTSRVFRKRHKENEGRKIKGREIIK